MRRDALNCENDPTDVSRVTVQQLQVPCELLSGADRGTSLDLDHPVTEVRVAVSA